MGRHALKEHLSRRPGQSQQTIDSVEFDIAEVAARVREWVLATNEVQLLADALQLEIAASTGTADIGGVIPTYSPLHEHRHDYVHVARL